MSDDFITLAGQLQSADVGMQRRAAEQLLVAGEAGAPAAVALVEACVAADESVREAAAGALESLGPPLPSALKELVTLCSHPQADVAYWAATLLGRLKHQAADAVPVLENLLTQHASSHVRERAAWALGQIGADSPSAAVALAEAAHSSNARLARLAGEALQQIKHD